LRLRPAATVSQRKKPTTVASRGFLSKFNLTSTRRHGVAYDDNDRQRYLSNSINH